MENKNGPLMRKDLNNTLNGVPVQNEDEIDLVELIAILWRHRVLIVSICFFCTVAGIIYCLVATPLYEISAQIRPGITGYDEQGHPIRSLTPQAIRFWFSKKGYNRYTEENSAKTNKNKFPISIKASVEKESEFVSLSMYYPEKQNGIKILTNILKYFHQELKKSLYNEVKLTINRLNEKINKLQIELEGLTEQERLTRANIKELQDKIKLFEVKLNVLNKNKSRLEEMKRRLEKQVQDIRKNTKDLILLRKNMINPPNGTGADKFALLMYSNIIQQNISYITTLDEKIASIEKEISNFSIKEKQIKNKIALSQLDINNKKIAIERQIPLQKEGINKKITIIKAQIANLGPIEIIQDPFSSAFPVKPRKKLIMAMSITVGFFIAILCAFIKEFWQNAINRHNITIETD